MATKIQWSDETWNPSTGCTKVSPGCANCYIVRTPAFRIPGRKFVKGATDLRLHEDRLDKPLHWRKPRRVFVNSLSDLFHEDVPDAFIDKVFAVMALAPQHTFQVLTKRAERMRAYLTAASERWGDRRAGIEEAMYDIGGDDDARTITAWPLPDVWIGVSVENQHFADERIPLLLQTPAAVRFLSCEPLLAHLNIVQFLSANYISVGGRQWIGAGGIGWVIAGGESGPNARPCEVEWIRSIIQQCASARVPAFVKQLGAVPIVPASRLRHHEWGEGKFDWWPHDQSGSGLWRIKLSDRKGGDESEWPQPLRVREFPR